MSIATETDIEKGLSERIPMIEAFIFGIHLPLLMNVARSFLQTVNSRWHYLFLFGVAAGAGFELFKVHFKFRGVSFYSVYKKNQLKKQLASFEAELRELDNAIANSPEFADIPIESASS